MEKKENKRKNMLHATKLYSKKKYIHAINFAYMNFVLQQFWIKQVISLIRKTALERVT